MSNRRAPFTQADVTRAVKGAQNAGAAVSCIEIEPGGKIIILIGESNRLRGKEEANEWDEVLTNDAEKAS